MDKSVCNLCNIWLVTSHLLPCVCMPPLPCTVLERGSEGSRPPPPHLQNSNFFKLDDCTKNMPRTPPPPKKTPQMTVNNTPPPEKLSRVHAPCI